MYWHDTAKKLIWLRNFAILLGIIAIIAIAFSVRTALLVKDKSETEIEAIAQEAVKSMKLTTITYYYTDSIFISEEEEWMLFGLFDIDPGVRYLAVQYNGKINLGIDLGLDAKNLKITKQGIDNEGKTVLKITLPEAREISHEQFRNDEVTIFQDGKYTKHEVSRVKLNEVYEGRKDHYSESIRSLGLYDEAEESAKSQIGSLLNLIPAIRDNCVIKWG